MEKRQELYRGKAKTVYTTDDPNVLVMHYRDDVSAFDGAKLAQLSLKGETNNKFNAFIMERLAAAGVPTHFIRVLNERESLVKAMKMIPVECVVRNICAGSMAKRYGIEEGTRLPEPTDTEAVLRPLGGTVMFTDAGVTGSPAGAAIMRAARFHLAETARYIISKRRTNSFPGRETNGKRPRQPSSETKLPWC